MLEYAIVQRVAFSLMMGQPRSAYEQPQNAPRGQHVQPIWASRHGCIKQKGQIFHRTPSFRFTKVGIAQILETYSQVTQNHD